jgi:hypothetical protein
MTLDALLADDPKLREQALAEIASAPDHVRSAIAAKVAAFAREAAATLALEEAAPVEILSRACAALAVLQTGVARACLLRIADEGTPAVKSALARALHGNRTPDGRAIVVHLLSDDDARAEALLAIGVAPWPEVLPDLIEIAETDNPSARLALRAIAKCGATAGPAETNAASDFLLEQLDDDGVFLAAIEALLRFGSGFPGVIPRARRLALEPGKRKLAGLCLLATDESHDLVALARTGPAVDPRLARAFLGPFRSAEDERVRQAAERTWCTLAL